MLFTLMKHFSIDVFSIWYVYKNIGFEKTEMQSEITLCHRFCKLCVKHPRSHKENIVTCTKPNSSRRKQITTSDSDHTCDICFALGFFV